MKYIKKFNEAIINYETDNIKSFYDECRKKLKIPFLSRLNFKEVKKLGDKYDIEIVDYKTFYDDLPDKAKHTAPPKGVIFGLVNPKTHKARIVMDSSLNRSSLDYVYHVLKHENVHIEQHSKRPGYNKDMTTPNNKKNYYSDTDEIMAFSQSISDQIMKENPKNINQAMKMVWDNDLFNDIDRNIRSNKIYHKYKKYIYLYLEKEFEKRKQKG